MNITKKALKNAFKINNLITEALNENLKPKTLRDEGYASYKDYEESEPTLAELQEDHVRGEVLEQQIQGEI